MAELVEAMGDWLASWTRGYATLLSAGLLVALTFPATFTGYNVNPNISLGVAMGCMGLALKPSSLTQSPRFWGATTAASVLIFPALALLAALSVLLLEGPIQLAIALAILAACPCGSASNLVPSRLSRAIPLGPVALLCTATTAAAALSFPAAVSLLQIAAEAVLPATDATSARGQYMGRARHVLSHFIMRVEGLNPSSGKVFFDHCIYSLAIPLGLGAALRLAILCALSATGHKGTALEQRARALLSFLPSAACMGVVVTATNKTAQNAHLAVTYPGTLLLIVALHGAAYALGYLLPRLAGLDRTTCRVCCIQAGARNPAVGLVLGISLLRGEPQGLAALAASVWVQNVYGAWLAVAWAASPESAGKGKEQQAEGEEEEQEVPASYARSTRRGRASSRSKASSSEAEESEGEGLQRGRSKSPAAGVRRRAVRGRSRSMAAAEAGDSDAGEEAEAVAPRGRRAAAAKTPSSKTPGAKAAAGAASTAKKAATRRRAAGSREEAEEEEQEQAQMERGGAGRRSAMGEEPPASPTTDMGKAVRAVRASAAAAAAAASAAAGAQTAAPLRVQPGRNSKSRRVAVYDDSYSSEDDE